jgi:hypothetical protein
VPSLHGFVETTLDGKRKAACSHPHSGREEVSGTDIEDTGPLTKETRGDHRPARLLLRRTSQLGDMAA